MNGAKMMLSRSRISLLLNTILALFYSSLGHTSNSGIEDFLSQNFVSKKKVFSCPQTLTREELFRLLEAPYKKVASQAGGSIEDQVAEYIEIKKGLWAAHKMPGTERLLKLLKQDNSNLITAHLNADEARPYGGTLGEEFESLIGTYYFYQKNSSHEQAQKLPGYSLIVTFSKKKH